MLIVLLIVLQSILALIAIVIVILTIHTIHFFTAIHGNCKILLQLCSIAQLFVVVSHIGKIVLLGVYGEFPQTKITMTDWNSPMEVEFMITQIVHECGYFLCGITEFLLVMERAVACKMLRKYDESPTHYHIVLPIAVGAIAAACTFSYLLHMKNLLLPCTVVAQCFDVSTLIVAVLCHRVSSQRYSNILYHSSALGSRYQLREVAELTRALVPISMVTVPIKLVAGTLVWPYIIVRNEVPYSIFMSIYQSLHTSVAIVWCTVLLWRHRGMKKDAAETIQGLFKWKWLETDNRNMPDIDYAPCQQQAQTYFDMLSHSWQQLPPK